MFFLKTVLKRMIPLMLAISFVLLTSCAKEGYEDQIAVGMTLEEYTAIVPEDIRYCLLNYECFPTADGKVAVVKFSLDGKKTVLDISVVKEGTPTAENFAKVKEGFTFLQLVETVGVPGEPYTSGVVSVIYMSPDGQKCDVNIGHISPRLAELYVRHVIIE